MTTLEKVGSRLYFANSPFAAKGRIKDLGGHWDGDRKQWWIGAAKRADAESLVAELNGTAPQFAGATATAASAKVAESVGLSADTPAGIVADAVEERGDAKAAADLRKPVEDISECRVYAQVEYKGRRYYVIAETKDRTRCRLATLQEDGPVYWADMSACTLIKTYPGREVWDGRRYSGRTVTKYTTIGSLRSFIAQQKRLTPEQREEQDLRRSVSACGRRDCRRLEGMFCTDCHDEE